MIILRKRMIAGKGKMIPIRKMVIGGKRKERVLGK